jgi:uncharacterized protein YecT (DUF1311 family)
VESRTLKAALASLALLAFSAEARAFDCAKAASKFEKAICADASARSADDALNKTFADFLAASDPKLRKTITSSQIAWLQDRDNACADSAAATLGACLARESDRRRAFLSGQPEQGPGVADKISPWFRFEKGGKGKAAVDMQLLKFADPKSPGERAFNDAADKLLEDIIEPEKDDPAADRYAFSTAMRLIYASPKLVSAQAQSYQDSGGAHPNSGVVNINLDVAAGRLLKFDDAFDPKSAEKIFATCLDQVKRAKKERLGDDPPLSSEDLADLAKTVKESTGDLSAWSFGATKATVTYSPYAVGAYAEGSYECTLANSALKPLVKAAFPLP